MTKNFIARVLKEMSVDTNKYRYIVMPCYNVDEQWCEIRRLPLVDLDTTAAIDGWETIWTSKEAK